MLPFNTSHPLSYDDIFDKINEYYTVLHSVTKRHDGLLQIKRRNKANEFIQSIRQEYINSHETIIYLKEMNDGDYTKHQFSNCSVVENIYVNHIWVMSATMTIMNKLKRFVSVVRQTVIIADEGIMLNIKCFPKLIDGILINKWKRNIIKRKAIFDAYITTHGKVIL